MEDFRKDIGDYTLRSHRTSESLVITRHINSSSTEEITLWRTEDIHDIHYALGRYLELRKDERR